MATVSAMKRPVLTASSRAASVFSAPARRTFINAQKPIKLRSSCASIRPSTQKSELRQPFRRPYADLVSAPTKRRGWSFFRWTWRLTYLSFIGGTAYLFYNIYTLRTPKEQFAPDPAKKTLVILGTFNLLIHSTVIDLFQVLVGARSLCSKSSTRKTTMSSSSLPATFSSSRLSYHHVPPAPSSTDRSWSLYAIYSGTRTRRSSTMKQTLRR
jgi:hypothetical protein